jgi:hypothetical protein
MRETAFFREDERSTWEPRLIQLARLNLSNKVIADAFGCSYSTLTRNQELIVLINMGRAHYAERIQQELYNAAQEDPWAVEDKEERGQIRTNSLKALAILHKELNRDPWVPPAEQEKLRRLSDEELQKELEKHLAAHDTKNGMIVRVGS